MIVDGLLMDVVLWVVINGLVDIWIDGSMDAKTPPSYTTRRTLCSKIPSAAAVFLLRTGKSASENQW
jgi:hypothetical protein